MSHESGGSSEISTALAADVIHTGSVGDDTTLDGKAKNRNKNESKSYVENRKPATKNGAENLTTDQVKEKVFNAVTELRKLEEFHHGDGLQYQKTICDVYWNCSNNRTEIGNYLADLGYAEITVKMMRQMNSLGIFKNDDVWFPTYYTYSACWNYSDTSQKLAKSLAESGIIKLMTLNLSHRPYLDNMQSKNVYYVLKASLGSLYNLARCSGVKQYFKEIKTVEVVLPLLSCADEFLKSMAVLTIAYIVEEEENVRFICEPNIIRNIIFWIHKGLENKDKRIYNGLRPVELAQALARLAVSDSNKEQIIEERALTNFVLMLQHMDPKEQSISAECLWSLSFDKNVRQKVLDFPDLMDALENLKDSENYIVRRNVGGALWLIKGKNDQTTSVTYTQSSHVSNNNVFISFSSNEKEMVKRLTYSLTAEGYKLLSSWEQIGGYSLQTMAESMERAAIVLICVSEAYKNNPGCRTEADYALQLKKNYICIIMQKHYKPEGWLSTISGEKLSPDFSGKCPFEKSFECLLKELREMAKDTHPSGHNHIFSVDETVASPTMPTTAAAANTTPSCDSFIDSPSSAPYSNDNSKSAALTSMNFEHVENWLMSKGLHRLTSAFSQIDGQLIWQLKKMRETTPEYFYCTLERQFGMSLVDILRFNAALDTL